MAGLAQYSPFFENPLFSDMVKEVPIEPKFISGRFLPRAETFELDWNESKIVRQQDMADIVDMGAELPLTDRDPLATVSGAIVDMGQKYVVTKKELAALADKGNKKRAELAAKQLLNKVKTIKGNIDARIEWMAMQALTTGQIAYAKKGIFVSHDFKVPTANKKIAAVKWDDVNPTIIADLEAWNQAYTDANGAPDVYLTSIKVIRKMMNDAGVRKAVTGLSDKLITLQELNDFLTGRQMARVEAFDTSVSYRDVDNGGVRVTQRLTSDKVGVFLKEGGEIGEMPIGPTVENDMNPGIHARNYSVESPKSEVVEVVAAAFPKILAPELIFITTVLA